MKISILSLHISSIMCISHMIKHPWKMSCEGIHQSLIGGRVYNVLAPSTPGNNGLSFFWSSRMLWGRGGRMRMSWWPSILSPPSQPRQTYKVLQVLRKAWEKYSIPAKSLQQSLHEGRQVSEQVGEQLGSIWPFRHTHCTHIPHAGQAGSPCRSSNIPCPSDLQLPGHLFWNPLTTKYPALRSQEACLLLPTGFPALGGLNGLSFTRRLAHGIHSKNPDLWN